MASTDTLPAPAVVSAAAALSFAHLADLSRPFAPPDAAALGDDELLKAQGMVAEIRRRVDAAAAAFAAEMKRRSRPELGSEGLAQRLGARTAEHLVQCVTGTSAREASTLVRVGTLMTILAVDSPEPDPTPWLRAVGDAVATGELSIEAADVIRAGIGEPDAVVTVEALVGAAETLLGEARVLTVEKLAARARDLRLELDL
ncbi:MAG: DUF222 domain-containing protein, partial [Rhodoglobus sp.]